MTDVERLEHGGLASARELGQDGLVKQKSVYLHTRSEPRNEYTRMRTRQLKPRWIDGTFIERLRRWCLALLSLTSLTRLTAQESRRPGEPLRADSVVSEEWEVDLWLRDAE
jgi:hypothetical protein